MDAVQICRMKLEVPREIKRQVELGASYIAGLIIKRPTQAAPLGGETTCRAVRFRQQPPDAGADLGPGEVVLVQRLDLRHREGLLHRLGRVHHGRAATHGGGSSSSSSSTGEM